MGCFKILARGLYEAYVLHSGVYKNFIIARFYVTRSACKQVLYGYFFTKPEAYIRIITSANEVVESSVFFRGFLFR